MFDPELSLDELKSITKSNKAQIANRIQFKNFCIMQESSETAGFKLILHILNACIDNYKKNFVEELGDRNIFLVQSSLDKALNEFFETLENIEKLTKITRAA